MASPVEAPPSAPPVLRSEESPPPADAPGSPASVPPTEPDGLPAEWTGEPRRYVSAGRERFRVVVGGTLFDLDAALEEVEAHEGDVRRWAHYPGALGAARRRRGGRRTEHELEFNLQVCKFVLLNPPLEHASKETRGKIVQAYRNTFPTLRSRRAGQAVRRQEAGPLPPREEQQGSREPSRASARRRAGEKVALDLLAQVALLMPEP